jgi:hypothetical protein
MSNSQPFLNPLPLSRASPPSLKFYSVSSQAQLKLFGAFPLWWGYAILPGGCSQSRFPENRLYKSGFDPQNDGRDSLTGPKVAVVFGKYSREALQGPDNTEPIRIHLSMDQVAK